MITIYEKAMIALRLPNLHTEDKRTIASEFISLLPTALHGAPQTLRAVRSAILKEAEREVNRTSSDPTGETAKTPPKRRTRKPRTKT